jgi:hypothetical protein
MRKSFNKVLSLALSKNTNFFSLGFIAINASGKFFRAKFLLIYVSKQVRRQNYL